MADIKAAGYELLASAARTADASVDLLNRLGGEQTPAFKGVLLAVDVTAAAATPIVTPTIQVPVKGFFETVLTFSTFTAIGRFTYLVYPGLITADFGGSDSKGGLVLPDEFRVLFDHADADSITYSVEAHFLR